MASENRTGLVIEGVLAVLVLGILLVAQLLHAQKVAKVGPSPTPITRVVVTTALGRQ